MFEKTEKLKHYEAKLIAFMDQYIYPNEKLFEEQLLDPKYRWNEPPIMTELKGIAKKEGLWNLFLPDSKKGAGLSNLEYATLCEIMGRSPIAPEIFNCSAPDTGNMEILELFGTEEQKKQWLEPLLAGEIRSTFSMTEPDVASSDATNIQTSIVRDGDHYVINGRKWWQSGIESEHCKFLIVLGKTNPNAPTFEQQSMIIVPKDTPGIKILKNQTVFGYEDAPHGHSEVVYENVRVPVTNILWEEGKGFAIAQARLGPGRVHHCMRVIGMAERALELMIKRADSRVSFGKKIIDQGVIRDWIAQSRIEIDQARLLTMYTAYMMDTVGNKEARKQIAMIKVAAPQMACKVIDRAIQLFGAGGLSGEYEVARMYARARTTRLADGPDEVHKETIAKLEIRELLKPVTI